jgi:hypothetical protein
LRSLLPAVGEKKQPHAEGHEAKGYEQQRGEGTVQAATHPCRAIGQG